MNAKRIGYGFSYRLLRSNTHTKKTALNIMAKYWALISVFMPLSRLP